MARTWRITREDGEDLGFAYDCFVTGAVSLEEFTGWLYRVLQDTDDFPPFLIDLINVDDADELRRRVINVVGFLPSADLDRMQERALEGIAYARFPDHRDDSITRGDAFAALQQADEVRRRFADFFPGLAIPHDERAQNGQSQQRRVRHWWLAGSSERALIVGEMPAIVRERTAAGQLSTCFEANAGLVLQIVTNGERAMVMLLARSDGTGGHAINPTATGSSAGYLLENGQEDEYADHDTVPLPTAFALIEHIGVHGTPPHQDWQTDY
ncbi:hypothetical protein [Salana multivorans]